MTSILSLFENSYFRIFFAAWTGFYLWQLIKGDEGDQFTEFMWMAGGFVIAMLYLSPKTVQQG